MYKKILLTIMFLCTHFIKANIDLLLPKSIQISFVSQQSQTKTNEVTSEVLYCIEVLQNISQIQEKRQLTLEEIIIAMKVIVYLHTHDSPYEQGIFVFIDNKTIDLPFSKQLFAEITQHKNNINFE